ncbi:MAG TPA: hypothetical protein VMR54_16155 [Thermoanaerobaculia bacterium]|nr:hypothetical protein [Thermoanaerobaculia bacterium]
MKKTSGKGKKALGKRRAVSVRLPLPGKPEARHGDRTKYDRAREKERLRRQVRSPENGQ